LPAILIFVYALHFFTIEDSNSIGSFVWDDLNADGLQDSNEPPITGAVVSLLVDSGGFFLPAVDATNAAIADQTTGLTGEYRFDNLPVGNYRVRVTPPIGYLPSLVQTVASNDDADGDSNIASEPIFGTYESATFTLSLNGEPTEMQR